MDEPWSDDMWIGYARRCMEEMETMRDHPPRAREAMSRIADVIQMRPRRPVPDQRT